MLLQPLKALSKTSQALINHVVFVLDGSWSMRQWRRELIQVVDGEIANLGRLSTELGQETRVTVYVFSERAVWCIFYDVDVLRVPSIEKHYLADGGTPLLDGTLTALHEIGQTAQLHGDHAFLVYVATDGEENRSRTGAQAEVERTLRTLPEHYTVGILVPDQKGRAHAERYGFPADNIAIWEPTSTAGIEDGGHTIRQATESYMTARSVGVRGTRSLFSTGVDAVNARTIKAAGLQPLPFADYEILPVGTRDIMISEFVSARGHPYVTGRGFYQYTKTETIQPQKQIAIVERATAKVFVGPQARAMIGLKDVREREKPTENPQYDIYVQSTAPNRKLITGTKMLLVLKPWW